jgi:hypothetical protein
MLTEAGFAPLTETKQDNGPNQSARTGYDTDVPLGGTSATQPGGQYPAGRANFMAELKAAYLACPWLSAPIDAIARTVTAGGLLLTPDGHGEDSTQTQPPNVQALQELLDTCNPAQDIIQLLRGCVTDIGVFGDAFIEVVWLLGRPVALYPLDPATMTVLADEHGDVTGYQQGLDTRTADFEPHEVIHIPADSPHGSLYGVGVAQKALLPTEIWLFTAGLLKATMRRGDPPNMHLDFPLEVQPADVRKWRSQYVVRNLGAENIGNPITTRGGATLGELQRGKIADWMATMDQARDTILSEAGVPPAQVGVIESGNLGGGTGTSQFKVFKVNTCSPIASIVLEKLLYHLVREGFGIEDWSLQFGEVDYRDDKTLEDIRDMRLRNGSWTLDRYLVDINEPAVGADLGGEEHVLVDRQNIVQWRDIGAMSAAMIASKYKTGTAPAEPEPPPPQESTAATRWRRSVARHYQQLVEKAPAMAGNGHRPH